MVVHMTGTFIQPKNEEVKVGDAVFVEQKGTTIEAAVVKRMGRRIKLMPEDKSGEIWVAPEECTKVVSNGAEELMSRGAREAERRAREEAARKAEEERKAAEKAEKEYYQQVLKDRENSILKKLMARCVPARDWCEVGKYCWTESPVLMDQTKDCFRVVWYEIDVDKDYGGVHAPPEIDLTEVDELVAEVVEREALRKEEEKKAKKDKKKQKKKTDAEVAAEEAEREAELEEDKKKQDAARKRAQDKLDQALKAFKKAEDKREPVAPPKYEPDLPPSDVTPPEHPANQKAYEDLFKLGHAGDRVYYTDGTMHSIPFVVGSTDKVLKGGGLAHEVVEKLGFVEKVVHYKSAYDGGITLSKHDCFPPEDPSTWSLVETDKWVGEFRDDQAGLGSEGW